MEFLWGLSTKSGTATSITEERGMYWDPLLMPASVLCSDKSVNTLGISQRSSNPPLAGLPERIAWQPGALPESSPGWVQCNIQTAVRSSSGALLTSWPRVAGRRLCQNSSQPDYSPPHYPGFLNGGSVAVSFPESEPAVPYTHRRHSFQVALQVAPLCRGGCMGFGRTTFSRSLSFC